MKATITLSAIITIGISMKLYYSPGACSLAAHIILEEIGHPFETQLVNTMDGSTDSEAYLNISTKGRVPALEHDGQVITEVSAILIYLAMSNPRSQLVASTTLGIARTIEWMNWLASIHASTVAQTWRTERFSAEPSAYPGIQQKGMENLRDTYEQIDLKLNGLEWAVEGRYSIADAYLLVFFRWGNRLGLDMSEYEHWKEHAERLQSRAAVKIVLATEGISIWS